MPINPNIKKILLEISRVRKINGITENELESKLNLGRGWIGALETGEINPPFDLMLSIIDLLKVNLHTLIAKINFDEGQALNRVISAEQSGNNLRFLFTYNTYDAEYAIENTTIETYDILLSEFRNHINKKDSKKADAVSNTFLKAIQLWPHVNPSDIWLFIVSRIFQDPYNHPVSQINRDFAQSWKRTGGWALEEIFVKYYKTELAKHDILIDIFQKKNKTDLLSKLKLNYSVQANKADVLLVNIKNGRYDCIGVVHVKASIAERRQNDQNFSQALKDKNFFSPFMTMDCKSFPSKKPTNRGELGSIVETGIDNRNDKRKEFEEEGYFSACFSFNSNTKPTTAGQKATARIYTMNFSNPNDAFTQMTIQARDRLYGQ
jgi:transcriptional regulator with XRE-family HTH domain